MGAGKRVEMPNKVLDKIALGGVQVPPWNTHRPDSLFLDPCGLIQKLNWLRNEIVTLTFGLTGKVG